MTNVLINTPDRESVLRLIKMLGDVIEKNQIEEYWELSEISAKTYKTVRTNEQQIEELRSEISALKSEISALKSDKHKLQNRVDDLSSQLFTLQKKLQELETH